jgi:2-polyprenyl-3-methyl-5-hydroxy-6-metoxy-1,4-benzoquinol methylase
VNETGVDQASRDRLYARYVSTHGQDPPRVGTEAWIRRYVIRRLPSSLEVNILDAGCGAGEVVELVRARGYRHVRGIDISSEQVARARERGIGGIELGDLRAHLQSNEATYDVITAFDVLEHFEPAEVLTVLDLVAAALRPGGMFLARVPNGCSPFMGRYRYGDFTHGTAASSIRFAIWKVIAALLKFSLAVETGIVRGHLVTQNIMVIARRPSARS